MDTDISMRKYVEVQFKSVCRGRERETTENKQLEREERIQSRN